ncbi:ABC transporter, putative [Angomonas deanei]|uniref:ABC transporter, putative n=1 Tax=Angomonas deanei TaxID=59799 RepID=A0A7G2CQ29_9TRYP|nr:ABC transporter, putative [Angomonas deanei]
MSAGESGGFAAKIGDARKASLRVFSVVDRVPDVDVFDPQRTATIAFPPAASGVDIQFQRTQFIYPARPAQLVLSSIDLHFSPGSNNGLMGQTGCGKSTIIQLLACFYAHRRGEIKLNSQWSLSNLDIRQWRQHISIVLQEPDLFSGTVRENILYSVRAGGKENEKKSSIAQGTVWDDEDGEEELPTEEEIMQAARWAGIHDDIMAMPEGYDTNVGYKGRALSGGQKQRVAIARGLLRRGTKLLLLDEATSALDNHTERVVQEGIEHYLQHRRQQGQPVTVVSIAHRLTTIQHCDQIVLLDAGRIKEQGSHAALMALGGEYKVRFELFTAGVEGS